MNTAVFSLRDLSMVSVQLYKKNDYSSSSGYKQRFDMDKAIHLPRFEYADILEGEAFGDWRDALATRGWVVVKGAVPLQRSLQYRDAAFDWLESFPLGFDRTDRSTWTKDHLPVHSKGGMFLDYGFPHEDFVWALRCEPGVIDAFATLWGTDRLVTSFDAGAINLPGRTDLSETSSWQHIDQSCHRRGFYCCQGQVNLNYNGPEDGGLMVLDGSSRLIEAYFDENGRTHSFPQDSFDYYQFRDDQQQWFFDRGCKWIKICAEPGDLILWDSRTMHYGTQPEGDKDRTCTYICMAPASLLSAKDSAARKIAFEQCTGTTHVPFSAIHSRNGVRALRDGEPDPIDRGAPRQPVALDDTVLRLAGIMSY